MQRQGCFVQMIGLLTVLLCVVLVGCAVIPDIAGPEPQKYTVTYEVNGAQYHQQRVEEGECPDRIPVAIQGLQVLGWQNEAGQLTDPAQVAVTSDVTYRLAYYPALTRHMPYLFANEQDKLRPDDLLTESELKQALEAVAAAGAKAYFPTLLDGNGAVDGEYLRKILLNFFPEDTIAQVLTGNAPVTRAAFAVMMNTLLGRDLNAPVKLFADAVLPVEITESRADAVQLLEASVGHTQAEDGTPWAQMDLPTDLEPGFMNRDGYLYYITEDGYYLKDGKLGDLYFGKDGRYTTGDTELDALVAGILKKLMEENPDKEGLSLLRVVHEYCRDSFKYLRRYDNALEVGATGWAPKEAKVMFTTGRGNCYNYAAAFWALSRGLGWETYAISGTCTKTDQPHGWCLINIDGADYFFDCEWEMAYRVQHDPPRYDMDMFMISMERQSYWRYKWTTY